MRTFHVLISRYEYLLNNINVIGLIIQNKDVCRCVCVCTHSVSTGKELKPNKEERKKNKSIKILAQIL